jgi:hypothetical protein
MRKLIWAGCALVVAGAAVVYYAAHYAAHHPDSVVGRCATAASEVGLRCNPFAVVGQLVQRQHPVGHGEEPFACPADPEACGQVMVHKPGHQDEGAEGEEMIEPIQVGPRTEVVLDEEEQQPFERVGIDFENPATLPVLTEGFTPAGTTEFRCPEESEEVPPMAEVEATTNPCESLLHFCADWVREIVEAAEASATEEAVKACKETIEPMTAATEEEEATESKVDDPVPSCQEDRDYHRQYPSCPYMGGCRYPCSGSTCHPCPMPETPRTEEENGTEEKAATEEETSATEEESTCKPVGDAEECDLCPCKPMKPCKPCKKKPCTRGACSPLGVLKKCFFGNWFCPKGSVDTMELRPGDIDSDVFVPGGY